MKHSLAMLLAASALAGPTAAFAQDAPAESQGGLDDIIVTAQKRAEGLSDVPISISAVSGKQVESYGQTNLEPVSYTHLDVYKRQKLDDVQILFEQFRVPVERLSLIHI